MSNYRIVFKDTLQHSANSDMHMRLRDSINKIGTAWDKYGYGTLRTPNGSAYSFDFSGMNGVIADMTKNYKHGDYDSVRNDANEVKADMNDILRTARKDIGKEDYDLARAMITYCDEVVSIVGELDRQKLGIKKR